MRRIRLFRRRLQWRTRVIIHVACVVLALALYYAGRGFPYLSWEQDLEYSLRRSLAHKADIIYSERVPDGLGTWDAGADETVYIVRWQDSVGAMRMMNKHDGSTWYGGPNREVIKFESRDGLFVIPLYGALAGEDGEMHGWTVAVVASDPAVERVEVTYCKDDADPVASYPAEKADNGVFIAEVELGNETYFAASVYDGLTAHNCLGAVAYNDQGDIVAHAASVWEAKQNEN